MAPSNWVSGVSLAWAGSVGRLCRSEWGTAAVLDPGAKSLLSNRLRASLPSLESQISQGALLLAHRLLHVYREGACRRVPFVFIMSCTPAACILASTSCAHRCAHQPTYRAVPRDQTHASRTSGANVLGFHADVKAIKPVFKVESHLKPIFVLRRHSVQFSLQMTKRPRDRVFVREHLF